MEELQEKRILRKRSRYFVRGAFRRFYVPALLSSFWLAVAGVADSIFVGNGIGSAGLAAISLGQPIYLFYNILYLYRYYLLLFLLLTYRLNLLSLFSLGSLFLSPLSLTSR